MKRLDAIRIRVKEWKAGPDDAQMRVADDDEDGVSGYDILATNLADDAVDLLGLLDQARAFLLQEHGGMLGRPQCPGCKLLAAMDAEDSTTTTG